MSFHEKLRGRIVLVIGGTSGIGLATAHALLQSGCTVMISGSRAAKVESVVRTLRTDHPAQTIGGFVCNLAVADTCEADLAALSTAVTSFLRTSFPSQEVRIHHLIYTAGDSLSTMPLSSFTTDKFHAILQVRAASAILAVKTFLPLIPCAATSSITLTAGSIYEKPIPGGWSVLAFIGAGLTGLTRQLAADLAPVRVNAVAPGVVDTELWTASGMTERAREEFMAAVQEGLLTKRVPRAQDVAESYVYLLRASNVTGAVVDDNGGAFLA